MIRLTAVCAAIALLLTACASDTTNPNASSHHAATASKSASPHARPTSCTPNGSPSGPRPLGKQTVGRPV